MLAIACAIEKRWKSKWIFLATNVLEECLKYNKRSKNRWETSFQSHLLLRANTQYHSGQLRHAKKREKTIKLTEKRKILWFQITLLSHDVNIIQNQYITLCKKRKTIFLNINAETPSLIQLNKWNCERKIVCENTMQAIRGKSNFSSKSFRTNLMSFANTFSVHRFVVGGFSSFFWRSHFIVFM